MSNKIQRAEDFQVTGPQKVSPATRAINEANENGMYSIPQSAEIVGVGVETLRRLLKSDRVKAPTHVTTQGNNHYWLLDQADLLEVGEYFAVKKQVEDHLKAKNIGEDLK